MYKKTDTILGKLCDNESVSLDDALAIYKYASINDLMFASHRKRIAIKGSTFVTWHIDRNVNTTNICISGCKFCNFHCKLHQRDRSYVTTIDEYCKKIDYMSSLGGDQLLLQGGMHPLLGLSYYEDLFRELKRLYPWLKLHALGAPEVAFLADKSSLSDREVLERLVSAGLTSLPGAGAEILDSKIRKRISPGKCSAERWLSVMMEAHKLGLLTSATMMYGHIETPRHRIEHLFKLRDLQRQKPDGSIGFISFIPWAYQSKGTVLEQEGVKGQNSMIEYIRLIAISRLILDNIPNIQASWLTMGVASAQMALNSGANDMGSIMIEENVVSSVGVTNKMNVEGMKKAITDAGFEPKQRNTAYELLEK